jgi:hypothetical protein
MALPLQIYLDSNDYSRLARPPAPEFVAVLDRLRQSVASGQIEIRLSGALVAEGAPLLIEHLQYAMDRFRLMRELSAGHCFIPPDDLIATEARVLYGLDQPPPTVRREQGNWLPRSLLEDISFPAREDFVKQGLARESMTRQQRRAIERVLFTKQGRLTAQGEHQFRVAAQQMREELQRNYPVSPDAERLLVDYMKGRVDGAKVFSEMLLSLGDLEIFGKWLALHWQEVHPVTTWIRTVGASLKEKFESVTEQTATLWESGRASGLSNDQIIATRDSAMRGLARRMCLQWARQSIGEEQADLQIAGEPWELAPGITVATAVLEEIIKRATLGPGRSRRFTHSDGVDMLHSCYIPYVDLFRADGFMASVLNQSAPTLRGRVVSDLLELPTRINQLLATAER